MKNLPRTIRLALAGLLLASTLAAGTLERARQLLDAGDLEGASREAAAAVAAAEGEERAAALDLVGAIAVEARRWEEARAAWTRLADEHPASPLAEQARTKLALLEALSATPFLITYLLTKTTDGQNAFQNMNFFFQFTFIGDNPINQISETAENNNPNCGIDCRLKYRPRYIP